MGGLPNLVVIGAMKCGTSALHYCIDLHPNASMSTPKELNYFFDEPQPTDSVSIAGERELQMIHMRDGNWRRGPDWYAEHFSPEAKVRGESSPAYTAPWHPDVAERMATLVPDAKLIFLVRDPIARMISQYRHHLALGREWRDLDEALTIPNGVYIGRSRYWARPRALCPDFRPRRSWSSARSDSSLSVARRSIGSLTSWDWSGTGIPGWSALGIAARRSDGADAPWSASVACRAWASPIVCRGR